MQLIKYFFIVIVTSFLITTTVTWVVNNGLKRSGVDFYGKINAAGDTSQKTNLLLVGSSRMLVEVDPAILDSITRLNSYNYGLNAATIKSCFNLITYALHFKKNVEAAVLNIDYSMFDVDQDVYKDAYYYPFEKKVHGFLMSNSGNAFLIHKLKFMDISLYDDFVKYAAIDGWLRPGRVVQGLYKGYYPHRTVNDFADMTTSPTSKTNIPFREAGLKILNNCIELCRQHDVKLILVLAPYYKTGAPGKYYSNYYYIIDRVKQLAKQNDIPFFDYSAMAITNDSRYFYNTNHLNVNGASVYSVAVADSLKNYLDVIPK